ncbi:MAG: hypothetical protein ACFFA3_14860 [Promethearchaeota archaeon]
MSKKVNNCTQKVSLLIIVPNCYGNFKSSSNFCLNCDLKRVCEEIPPPKEPKWCNPE